MKRKPYSLLLPLLLLLGGCGDNFFAPSGAATERKIAKGNGEWEIEQIDAWAISRDGTTFIGKVSKSNVGTFIFEDDEKAGLRLNDGKPLDMQYFDIYEVDVANGEWSYTGGFIDLPLNMSGYVTMIDGREMEIICPYNLNSWLTYKGGIINASVEMKFKLRKK